MTIRFSMLLAFTLTLMGTNLSAETYKCELSRGGGWIAPVIFLLVDEQKGTAFVQDGITQSKKKGWFDARLTDVSDRRFTVKWQVKNLVSQSGQGTIADYNLTFIKRNKRANAQMQPRGYDNMFNSSGACAVVK